MYRFNAKKTIINGFNGFTSLSPECQKLQFKVCVWKAWSRWSEFAKDKMRQQSWHTTTTTTTTTTTIMTKTIWLRSSLINFAFRKTRLGLQDLGHGSGGSMVSMLFKKMGHSRSLFRLFLSFQTFITIFTTKILCEYCPFSILCWDSNTQPSEHEYPPITTRPGLPFL